MSEWNPIFQYLPLESRIQEFQDGYYDAIAACHGSGNSNAFITFMLDKINLTLDWALDQATQKDAYLPETVQKLLDVMDFDVPYSAAQLMEKLGLKSRASFRKLYLLPALEKNLIAMVSRTSLHPETKPTSENNASVSIDMVALTETNSHARTVKRMS